MKGNSNYNLAERSSNSIFLSWISVQLLIALFAVFVAIVLSAPAQPEEFGLKDDLKTAKKYAKLIEKEGEKAWHFLECMGKDWTEHCVSPTVACVAAKDIPGCIELIVCEGKDAKACASSFK